MAPQTRCAPFVRSPGSGVADAATQPQGTPGTNGRDSAGRFAKGNGGGPGNPFARQVAELRRAALAATTPAKIAEVIGQLEKQALEGDVAAAKLYLSYTLGRPAAAVDPDTLDVQEAMQLQREVGLLQEVTQALLKPLLATLLDIVRVSRPEATGKFIAELLDGFAAQDQAERASAAEPSTDRERQDAPVGPSANGTNRTQRKRPARPPRARPASSACDRHHPDGLPIANADNGDQARGRPQPPCDPDTPSPRRRGRSVPRGFA
jgi:hypothetical protein